MNLLFIKYSPCMNYYKESFVTQSLCLILHKVDNFNAKLYKIKLSYLIWWLCNNLILSVSYPNTMERLCFLQCYKVGRASSHKDMAVKGNSKNSDSSFSSLSWENVISYNLHKNTVLHDKLFYHNYEQYSEFIYVHYMQSAWFINFLFEAFTHSLK